MRRGMRRVVGGASSGQLTSRDVDLQKTRIRKGPGPLSAPQKFWAEEPTSRSFSSTDGPSSRASRQGSSRPRGIQPMPSQPTTGTWFRISDISDWAPGCVRGSFGAGSPRRESGSVQYFWLQINEGNHSVSLFRLIFFSYRRPLKVISLASTLNSTIRFEEHNEQHIQVTISDLIFRKQQVHHHIEG